MTGALLAGVARVDITPHPGIELFGYHRSSPMTGVHDPLWLTALALVGEQSPSQPCLLLAIDHVGLGWKTTQTLRAAVAAIARTPQRTASLAEGLHALYLCFGGYTNGVPGYLATADPSGSRVRRGSGERCSSPGSAPLLTKYGMDRFVVRESIPHNHTKMWPYSLMRYLAGLL